MKLVYTLVYENSVGRGDEAGKRAEIDSRMRFERALANMKSLAEGGTLSPPERPAAIARAALSFYRLQRGLHQHRPFARFSKPDSAQAAQAELAPHTFALHARNPTSFPRIPRIKHQPVTIVIAARCINRCPDMRLCQLAQ